MTFKTIFWDNDGTLVNTEPLYFAATQKVLASLGVELTREWYMTEHLKKGTNTFSLIGTKKIGQKRLEQLRVERNEYYLELLKTNIEIFDGVIPTLEKLYGKIPMGIVTTSQKVHFERIMQSTNLKKYFDFVITQEDTVHQKPNPEPYLKAWRKSGLSKKQCLVIEDTERGVTAAKAAGLTCFAIPNTLSKDNDFSKADRVLKNLEEILDFM